MSIYSVLELKELYNRKSEHHHIVIEGNDLGKVLHLDGRIRLTTWDIHRYSECLSIVPYLFTKFAKKILILGGGDGYTAKTLLDTFAPIETMVLVEQDPDLVSIARAFLEFPEDERLKVIYQDPYIWIDKHRGKRVFDLVIADYLDPVFAHLSRLFTVEHFKAISEMMTPEGVFAVPMVPPLANAKAASCLVSTVKEAFPSHHVTPYRVHMHLHPAPASQGFCLAARNGIQLQVPEGLKFLNSFNTTSIFWLDNDEGYMQIPPSTDKNTLYYRLIKSMFARDLDEWEEPWEE